MKIKVKYVKDPYADLYGKSKAALIAIIKRDDAIIEALNKKAGRHA